MVTICYKNEKILQNWYFCKIFDFTSEAHITKKLRLLILIVIFSEFTTNIVLKPIVIFPKINNKIAQFFQRIYTKYNVDFTRKMTLAQNIIAQNDTLNQNNNYPTNEIL